MTVLTIAGIGGGVLTALTLTAYTIAYWLDRRTR